MTSKPTQCVYVRHLGNNTGLPEEQKERFFQGTVRINGHYELNKTHGGI
jgi:hypothetical protein